jgi:GH25 family lysozyme M1 (1,4-beta-N-acetylmuramidase)
MFSRGRLSGAILPVVFASCGPPDDTAEVEQGLMVCPSTVVEGVDVYDGNLTVAWHSVYNVGRRFAFVKASQGDYNRQTTFRENWFNTHDAGVRVSPYHFFDPSIDGVKQAQHFLDIVADAGGIQADDLPAMLDIECPTSSVQAQASPNCEYPGNSGFAPSATIQSRIFDWLNTVEAATGKKPIIYSYVSWFASVGVTNNALADYPLYIASYNPCATIPAPWTSTVFWQYSASGTVMGISGQVDEDRFVGSQAQLIAFASGTSDGGRPDAGPPDAGRPDAGPPDSGIVITPLDGGSKMDAGMPVMDSGTPGEDAGMNGAPDSGTGETPDGGDMNPMTGGGCGCGASGFGPALALLALIRAARSAPSRRRRSA